MKGMSKVHW